MKGKLVKVALLTLATMIASAPIAQESLGYDEDDRGKPTPYEVLNPARDFLIVGDICYAFLPPVSPAVGLVGTLSWSPNGEQLIVSSSETPSGVYRSYLTTETGSRVSVKNFVTVFDVKSGSSRVVLRGNAFASYENLQWRGDGQMAFVEERRIGDERRAAVLHCIDIDGRVTSLQPTPGLRSIFCDKKSNLVAAVRTDPKKEAGGRTSLTVCALDKNFRFISLKTPKGYVVTTFGMRQGDMGVIVLLSPVTGDPEGKHHYGRIDPITLSIEVLPDSISSYVETYRISPIDYYSRSSGGGSWRLMAYDGLDHRIRVIPIVVAQEAELFWEAPGDRAVAYTSKGLLMVREVVKVDKVVYDKIVAAKERQEAIIRCKNVAMALLMYATDHEDALPTSNADQALLPYLKSESALFGFVFTFKAGSLADIKEQHRTEIGYIMLPGGRAVAYADGHVSWVPDKS